MKKYPFSKKAIQAMLATAIAISPVVTNGILSPAQVEAAETTPVDVDKEIDSVAAELFSLYKSANIITPTAKIGELNFDKIKQIADDNGVNLGKIVEEQDKAAFEQLTKAVPTYAFKNYNSAADISLAIKEFRTTQAGAFNELFETSDSDITVNQLILFGKDFRIQLEYNMIEAQRQGTYDIKNIVDKTVADTFTNGEYKEEYKNLDGTLSTIGLATEDIALLMVRVYQTLDSDKMIGNQMIQSVMKEKGFKIQQEGFVFKLPLSYGSMFYNLTDELEWTTDNPAIATFSGNRLVPVKTGTVKVTAKFKGYTIDSLNFQVTVAEEEIVLPPDVAPVTSDQESVTITVPKEKVQEVVNRVTPEKNTISLPIGELSEGKTAKADLPATLFTQVSNIPNVQNPIVSFQTGEATYNLPIKEIAALNLGENDKVSIAVKKVDKNTVNTSLDKRNFKSEVIEFTVQITKNGTAEEMRVFSSYVERTIVGSANFDPTKQVAVILREDGTYQAIPTVFKGTTATIKSLTNSKYTIVENNVTDQTFKDFAQAKWGKDYIKTLTSKYIINGYPGGTFAPTKGTTRAEFMVLLVRALGLPSENYSNHFSDVKGNEWFNKNGELMAAVNTGIIKGRDTGKFDPNAKITRVEAAAMISRAMELGFLNYDQSNLDASKKLTSFKDASKIPSWAKEEVLPVYQAGIMEGHANNTFEPNGTTTREQVAKIVAEFLISADLMNDTIN